MLGIINVKQLDRVIDKRSNWYFEHITDLETGEVRKHCEALDQHCGTGQQRENCRSENSFMAIVDFQPINLDKKFDLLGTITMTDGKRPIVFLFAEKHDDNNVVGQNLHNALELFDAHLVETVGVEQYHVPPYDVKAEISKEKDVQKCGGIAGYGNALRKDFGGTDAAVIEKIRALPNTPGKAGQSFARNLLFLRPNINITGVEDPTFASGAAAANTQAASMFTDVKDETERRKKQIAEFRKLNHEGELKRDAAFLKHADEANQRPLWGGGIIINGGGRHMKRLEADLKAAGRAVVLIVPEGYKDVLDD